MNVEKIEIKNNIVKVSLSDNISFQISLETYLNNTILLNTEITNEEIEKLKYDENIQIAKQKLITKLYRKKLSKRECKSFVKELNINDKECDELIEDLERNYLINDIELTINIIDYCLVNKKGIDLIIEKIKDRKLNVDKNLIAENLNYEKYLDNIKYLIKKYQKMAKNKSEKQLRKYIENKLIENGYRNCEFADYLIIEKPDEFSIVVKEINKFFNNREKNKENITKITKKLLSKGFNYDIIKKALGSDYNETY